MKKVIKIIIFIIIFVLILLLYSRYIGTLGFKVKEYKVVNEKIPDDLYGLKVVHLSDIHYGRTVNKEKLKKIIDRVNFIKPDIVVITGDLLDRDIEVTTQQTEEIVSLLNGIDAKFNKYIISGNHDYTHNEWSSIINKTDFINLNNKCDIIYGSSQNSIVISGISTMNDNVDIESKISSTHECIVAQEQTFKILLLHEPDVIDNFDYNDYDLILAGHSHNGQVRLPFVGAIVLPPNAKKYYDEYYDLNNTKMYISSGLGTSNINFRLFNRPSFNFYRLTNK